MCETVPETVAEEETPVERVAAPDETVARKRCPACGYALPKKSTERVKKWRAKKVDDAVV